VKNNKSRKKKRTRYRYCQKCGSEVMKEKSFVVCLECFAKVKKKVEK